MIASDEEINALCKWLRIKARYNFQESPIKVSGLTHENEREWRIAVILQQQHQRIKELENGEGPK